LRTFTIQHYIAAIALRNLFTKPYDFPSLIAWRLTWIARSRVIDSQIVIYISLNQGLCYVFFLYLLLFPFSMVCFLFCSIKQNIRLWIYVTCVATTWDITLPDELHKAPKWQHNKIVELFYHNVMRIQVKFNWGTVKRDQHTSKWYKIVQN
jgi:hypothetical protein